MHRQLLYAAVQITYHRTHEITSAIMRHLLARLLQRICLLPFPASSALGAEVKALELPLPYCTGKCAKAAPVLHLTGGGDWRGSATVRGGL